MGHAASRTQDSVLSPPPGYVTPSFPSLHNPALEFHRREEAQYLFYSKDIYRFTLYWTLIMYALTYGACGVWAGIVQAVAARRKGHGLTSSMLVVLVFLTVGSFSAVIGSAVIGYVLAAVYSVGSFAMSTWVPFLWALVQTLAAIMGSYSTIITLL
ncbi:hypothetical protein BS47DRAFT_1488499 [Hydnum rufescens UP504]|uniref:Integral membrane protein n=1 Tax=Hydnum rufescens UP504 TaxID=1448309 RepID=A0A9P6ALM9_9AGAM|nr:hypothetical protein BS47DRAFT_1488499 [Hydnum rufescens UP504]